LPDVAGECVAIRSGARLMLHDLKLEIPTSIVTDDIRSTRVAGVELRL
jgi:hypothetical protein